MKIALCLSGKPKFLEENQPFIFKYLLDRYDIDVYMHVWEESYSPLLKRYNPNIKVERYESFVKSDHYQERLTLPHACCIKENALAMFYGVSQVNSLLRSSSEDYDLVVRMRADMRITDDVNLTRRMPLTDIFILVSSPWGTLPFFACKPDVATTLQSVQSKNFDQYITDHVSIGTPTATALYSQTYDRIPDYIRHGMVIQPEVLTAYNLHVNGLYPLWQELPLELPRM